MVSVRKMRCNFMQLAGYLSMKAAEVTRQRATRIGTGETSRYHRIGLRTGPPPCAVKDVRDVTAPLTSAFRRSCRSTRRQRPPRPTRAALRRTCTVMRRTSARAHADAGKQRGAPVPPRRCAAAGRENTALHQRDLPCRAAERLPSNPDADRRRPAPQLTLLVGGPNPKKTALLADN